MQAIILAAGMGKRLKELTKNNTKCMVRVNGVTLIERMLGQLDAFHLDRIVIVVGYEGQKLIDYISTLPITTKILYVTNPIYDKTNNIYSLALARDYLIEDDTILLESDLIFEDRVLECLFEDPRETLALVDKYESWMDGTVVELDEEDHILSFVGGSKLSYSKTDLYYKTVNIYKFSREFSVRQYVPFLMAYSAALGNNEYYEQVLRVITVLENAGIRAKRLEGQSWYEIDDEQDLDIAESMFVDNAGTRLEKFQKRYGGYWRYPKLVDYCYLVNPYFPPARLVDEMKNSFAHLLTQYPSGMAVNSLLAAKNFGVKRDYVVVGNGASELIKGFLDSREGKVGFIRPTFEEYYNRCEEDRRLVLDAKSLDFQYGIRDILDFFREQPVKTLILINPDNPSGNYISRRDLLTLCAELRRQGCFLLVDESFVDFAEGEETTLLQNEILEAHPNLLVMKSISKSYGVPGLRLGIAASADRELIARLRARTAIWNINSFAEFYMQIAEKYHKDYGKALERFRQCRKRFLDSLRTIPGLKVYPTQANFVMCGLEMGTSRVLAERLLEQNVLIKDLTPKIADGKQYIRLAVRTEEENDRLVELLREIAEKKC